MLNQKSISSADGELEVVVAKVEVEKTMFGFLVIDELAGISTPAGLAAK
jgi:hypothetical protein